VKFNIGTKSRFDLGKVNLNLYREINLIAGMVVKDHKDRLNSGMDIKGKPFKKLADSTIASKRKKKYKKPRVALIATGMMQKFPPFKKATKANQVATIKPAEKRLYIGAIHQEGTSTAGKNRDIKIPQREWYGVTDIMASKAILFMEKEIERRLARA
tara:strand:- start:556 stop:1026 length:471 start_codon:yes stop_codon:yes gene_type:complete